jgi:hypothetical protein
MKLQLGFKLQDCWIGFSWQRKHYTQHLWVCIIPMLPLHFYWDVEVEERAKVNRELYEAIGKPISREQSRMIVKAQMWIESESEKLEEDEAI